MGTTIEVRFSLSEISSLIDLIEEAQDKGVNLTESQNLIYKDLQAKEAEELI